MNKRLNVIDLGRRPYAPVFEMQEEMVRRRLADEIPDTLLLVEHDPVYTLGRGADSNNITASADQLRAIGIDVAQTSRGGDVTYHGPGQIVGYPIIDLGKNRKVLWYVSNLEKLLIDTLSDYDINASTDPENRGVWVGRDKIAAIGIRITRRITMHGFALNVRTDLDHYAGIVACGIQDRGVTSMHNMIPGISMDEVKRNIINHFQKIFQYQEVESC